MMRTAAVSATANPLIRFTVPSWDVDCSGRSSQSRLQPPLSSHDHDERTRTRRRRHQRRHRPVPPRPLHGRGRRIPADEPGHGDHELVALGRLQRIRPVAHPADLRHRIAFLQRTLHRRMAAHHRRRGDHLRRHPHAPRHLLSAHQPVQYSADAGAAGGRDRARGSLSSRAVAVECGRPAALQPAFSGTLRAFPNGGGQTTMRRTTFLAVAVLLVAAAAVAQTDTVRCESANGMYVECRTGMLDTVTLSRTLNDTSCVQGQTWGYRNNVIWVDRGCRAEFMISPSTDTITTTTTTTRPISTAV